MNNFENDDRPVCVCDTECFPNYWAIGFRSVDDRSRTAVYELYDGCELNKKAIAKIFRTKRVVTFNGIGYDIPMIMYAMSGASPAELKRASDEIIQLGTPHWVFMQRMELEVPDFVDHIDLMNVSPGAAQKPSLKLYAGRLHSRRMQELPYDIDHHLGPDERDVVRNYLANDLDDTIDLYNDLRQQLELRSVMSREYGVDLRSKSDAQIAEVVIKAEAEKALGRKVYKPEVTPHFFNFQVPDYMNFETEEMREVLEFIRRVKFKVNAAGIVEAPDRLKGLDVKIGGTVYRMGLGGLHSKESRVSHYSDEHCVLKDRDVTSYYPQSIINQGMYPKSIGPKFLDIYKSILDRRIAAKRAASAHARELARIDARIAEIESLLKGNDSGQ